ncbi:hypothetical protein CCACVL1_13053 [Corchorus capsularis]|uniref:Uncharacterized protein n=1 Tax=Corchorus capsularis TaxID=210143 RepID=A0A1R3ICI4_COCAP|nr:hypothetical protein CCACVL1_13053 [Corchorus capsularis]
MEIERTSKEEAETDREGKWVSIKKPGKNL